jgi:hypothetical protein
MEKNRKYFNKYVFLSTFARNLIELFIGTILFKAGFDLKSVIFYYLFVNVFSFFIAFPCIYIAKKHSNKILTILGIIAFILVQVALNYIKLTIGYLLILSFLYALYRRAYWMSRRYYTLQVIDKNNTSKEYSFVSIFNQLALLLSSYVGSLLLEYININIITCISIMLLLVGFYCIYKMDFEYEINKTKINIFETVRITPISSIISIGCYELQNVITFLLPLYIVIYVKNTYTAVGIINLLAQLATIVCVYAYGMLINKDKNYLKLSLIFLLIFKVLQVNTYGIVLFIITFISGLATKMYEQSFNKELLILSKNYEFHNFNLLYECTQNLFRTITVAILFYFVDDVKIMLYVVLAIIAIPLLVKFNTKPTTKKSDVIWKEKN